MALDGALEPHLQPDPLIAAAMSSPKAAIADLEESIGHRFSDRKHLYEALTHMSVGKAPPGRAGNYQRLEFLGDRVLGLVMADLLFRTYPGANEGELSKRFSELVRKETCAAVAERWGVAPHIILGAGVPKLATRTNRAILGDVCEAIIGAVYVDGGFPAVQAVVEAGFRDIMASVRQIPRDPKTVLQEWVQGKGGPPPTYAVLERTGPEHAPEFRVGVDVAGIGIVAGTGPSKRAAEQDAALTVLKAHGVWKEESSV